MIQDIGQHIYHNEYSPREPKPGDILFVFQHGKIQCNVSPDGNLYFPKVEESTETKKTGKNIQNCLREGIADGNKRIAKPAPENLYIFKGCHSTAVVVECGFLSNPEEEAKLRTDTYQKQLCCVIAAAVSNFLDG